MTLRTRVVTGIAAVGLSAGMLVTPAQAAVGPPNMKVSAMQVCNPPSGAYQRCYNDRWWKQVKPALDWSDSHPDKSDRRPVPYPAETSRKILQYQHVVYVILYQPKGSSGPGLTVYKYGITMQHPFERRADRGVASCRADKNRLNCRADWIAVTNYTRGFWTARYIEASMIKAWQRKNGACPIGQVKSCR